MITPEILSYVQKQRAQNIPDATIKANLLSAGWSEQDITSAMATSATSAAGGVPAPLTTSIALKKYRSHKRLIVFLGAVALEVIFTLWNSLAYGITAGIINSGTGLYLALSVLITYLAAYIATRGITPRKTMGREIGDTLIRIMGTVAIMLMLSFAIAFVGCWVLIATGGLRGL